MNWKTATLICALAVASVAPALGDDELPTLTDAQVSAAKEFALNNTQFIINHELGHMLVDQLELPILGREEDAVDNLAAFVMLTKETGESDTALADAAYGWLLMDKEDGDEITLDYLFDEHSLSIQRAYNIVCLMVGNDHDRFDEIADFYEMDEERRHTCAFDYYTVVSAAAQLLAPHVGEGAPITVTYGEADEELSWVRQMLMESGVMEQAAEDYGAGIDLPNPINIEVKQCGEFGAHYDFENAEILICYEMTDIYFDILAEDMLEDDGA